jgi:ribosomal protein S18 acetylase RimI-like enzyme
VGEGQTTVRRLAPGDEEIVRKLATRAPQTALLADPKTVFMAAFDGELPVGFAFGHVLPRRHGEADQLFVYEIEVDGSHRRQGLATELLAALAREAGVSTGFVLTEPENDAANELYRSLGGQASEAVMWDFTYAES